MNCHPTEKCQIVVKQHEKKSFQKNVVCTVPPLHLHWSMHANKMQCHLKSWWTNENVVVDMTFEKPNFVLTSVRVQTKKIKRKNDRGSNRCHSRRDHATFGSLWVAAFAAVVALEFSLRSWFSRCFPLSLSRCSLCRSWRICCFALTEIVKLISD